MNRTLGRVLTGFLAVLLVLSVLLAALGVFTVRRSFPQVAGDIRVPGLQAPVDVYRDAYGVPHIYAASPGDLFFAQGYVHAQDRFWQMDFWRHIGAGELSEMFGEGQLETDLFLRTLGWKRIAETEFENMDATSRALLQSYTDGVNAYLAERSGSALSLEYAVLGLLSPDYAVEPWTTVNSLTWAKVMAWDLRGNMDDEIERAALLQQFTPEQVADLFPPYPEEAPIIVPQPAAGVENYSRSDTAVSPSAGLYGQAQPALQTVSRRMERLEALLGPAGTGIGSNNWTISGRLTASGQPLLANDPHLSEQMPSIWYEIGLHCQPVSAECPYEVTGFSFAGAPGVIVGHNRNIAWGVTNVGPDVQDLYIEKINPENPNQYEFEGRWVDMEIVEEVVNVAGAEPVPLTVRRTRHGPIISGLYGGLEDFQGVPGADLPEPYAIALRWTALEPANLFSAIWKFNRASNWEEFREGTRDFVVPAQNLVYADVEGNIGYQMPGYIPIRSAGDGSLPVPGWTGEYEWSDRIPFEELPFTFNPDRGYVTTANNAVVGAGYPYLISTNWDYGSRAARIVQLIEEAPGPIDPAYVQAMQGDNFNQNASRLVPVILQLPLEDASQEQARALLSDWDYQSNMDSAPAALFEVFWRNLLVATFHDQLPEDLRPEGGSRWYVVVERLLDQPESEWWDDLNTATREDRDAIFRRAFEAAIEELQDLQGVDPQDWSWGEMHTVVFHHQTLGLSGVAPIEALFNRGPFPTAGGSGIVNATSWDAAELEDPYRVQWLPSMRMIVDLGDLENSRTMHTTGQSGHAFHPHYADMADPWRAIQYHPMLWERQQVEASVVHHLRLAP